MKSIQKKIKDDYPKSNILKEELSRVGYRVGFEKGANYVLEQIEKEFPLDDKCLNDYGKALVWRLKNCIEQLKE